VCQERWRVRLRASIRTVLVLAIVEALQQRNSLLLVDTGDTLESTTTAATHSLEATRVARV